MLLTAAVVVSILFVVVALLLNGATYTEIRAASGGSLDSPEAARGVHADVAAGTTTLLRSVNEHNATSYEALAENLTSGVAAWSALRDRHAATRVAASTLDLTATTNGTAIRQDAADRNLTSVGSRANWTLVTGATAVRDWHLTVARSSLVDPVGTPSASDLRNASAFRLVVDVDTGGSWRVFFYREDAANVTVAVEEPGGSIVGTCSAEAAADGRVAVDVTNGTVAGRACAALGDVVPDGSAVDLAHELGSNARGTYALDVDVPRSSIDETVYGETGSDEAPYVRELVFDATVRVHYATADLDYTTSVTAGGGADA